MKRDLDRASLRIKCFTRSFQCSKFNVQRSRYNPSDLQTRMTVLACGVTLHCYSSLFRSIRYFHHLSSQRMDDPPVPFERDSTSPQSSDAVVEGITSLDAGSSAKRTWDTTNSNAEAPPPVSFRSTVFGRIHWRCVQKVRLVDASDLKLRDYQQRLTEVKKESKRNDLFWQEKLRAQETQTLNALAETAKLRTQLQAIDMKDSEEKVRFFDLDLNLLNACLGFGRLKWKNSRYEKI